ncbi:hypothetical protein FRB94_013638 [Tulasnella sp. JGI-2019a]|nr:hypothetical protein FRB93_011036 [Tulasnella sp. JGI-2019a]KAG8990259.1 hypothetical protein FRB94_013638 [Tulasnella sp. JGI-2019a]
MATSRQSLRANTEQLDPRAKGEVIGQRPEYVRQPLPLPTRPRIPANRGEAVPIGQRPEYTRQPPPSIRFRIFVLGKSGTGKSALINHVLSVQTANVSSYIPGVCNIDREITSHHNRQFALHGSQGFECGEGQNLGTVQRFLRRRKEMDIRGQVHAIWLCVQCPSSKDRIVEIGDEAFLKENFDLPVILVFTKYDLIRNATESKMRDAFDSDEYDDDFFEALVNQMAEEEFQRSCIRPLEGIGRQHARVSSA